MHMYEYIRTMDISYPTVDLVASTVSSLYLVRITILEDAMAGPQNTKECPM